MQVINIQQYIVSRDDLHEPYRDLPVQQITLKHAAITADRKWNAGYVLFVSDDGRQTKVLKNTLWDKRIGTITQLDNEEDD